ncbi:hypothetical protein [Glycomyces sp. NPDC021274]|uniref:hypothetical protein n=1 Tax=Glycomyces sp. NPDC021274 TaxID=3155120 RepID=UPI00340D8D24
MTSTKAHARTELRIFYGVVLILALFGQSSGASSWLIPPDANEAQTILYWLLVFAFVAVLELGAVVLLRRAETQRRAGQRAWIAILTAIALALGAAALSWAGHWGPEVHEQLQAWAFSGSTLLGVIVWAIMADLSIAEHVAQHRAVRDAVRRYVKALTMDNAEKAVLIATMNIPLITRWILDGPAAVEGQGHERDLRIAAILATAIDPNTWHGHQVPAQVDAAPVAEPVAPVQAPAPRRAEPASAKTAPQPRRKTVQKFSPDEFAAAYQRLYLALGKAPSVTQLGLAGAWSRSMAGKWMQQNKAALRALEADALTEAQPELEGASA